MERVVDSCNESKRHWEVQEAKLDYIYKLKHSDTSQSLFTLITPSRISVGKFEELKVVKYVEGVSGPSNHSPLLLT
jgi:hypothetical protein